MSTALVFAAAPLQPTSRLVARLADLDLLTVIAADDGATTALAFGRTPDLVLGDFDSIHAATLRELKRRQVPIETHPRDKNATDGQLAIERALQQGPSEVFLLGFLGGPRLDQAVANLLLLTTLTLPAVLLDEQNECRLLRPTDGPLRWIPEQGEVVSLIPLSPTVDGVRTAGLRWPLNDESVYFGDTRGVSNEPLDTQPVTVQIASGLVLVTRHFPL